MISFYVTQKKKRHDSILFYKMNYIDAYWTIFITSF
jgi:hypothetical protein